MTATIFEWRGLRADNLQAFLALLGVLRVVDLRVVDLQCPKWRARAQWKNEAAGGLAEIEIEAENAVSKSDFVAAIAKGARELLKSLMKSIPETGAVEDAETVVKMNHENPGSGVCGRFRRAAAAIDGNNKIAVVFAVGEPDLPRQSGRTCGVIRFQF